MVIKVCRMFRRNLFLEQFMNCRLTFCVTKSMIFLGAMVFLSWFGRLKDTMTSFSNLHNFQYTALWNPPSFEYKKEDLGCQGSQPLKLHSQSPKQQFLNEILELGQHLI